MLNSSKRSVSLDLKKGPGREVFLDLVRACDVVIENFAPGTMERMGLAPGTLLELNPRLVYASGKGYGQQGPYAQMAAMDITVQAMSGTIATTGFPDQPPVKAGPAFADFLGGVHLFAGIASALFQRERTGTGQHVEVAMLDTVYPTLASALGAIYNQPGVELPERTGNRHSGLAVAPYNVYRALDGYVAIISISERHFEEVAAAAGRPDLPRRAEFRNRHARAAHMEELDAAIESWTSTLDRWSIVHALQARGVPCAPVLSVREVAEDPHLLERGMIRRVTHPQRGQVPVPGSPIRLSGSPVGDLEPAPDLGADTDAVLSEVLRYPAERIASLREAGVVA